MTASPTDRLTDVLGNLNRAGNAGSLVSILTAEADAGDRERVARLRWRFGSVTLVLFERPAYDPTLPGSRTHSALPAGADVVPVDGAHPFATAWNQAMAGRSLAMHQP